MPSSIYDGRPDVVKTGLLGLVVEADHDVERCAESVNQWCSEQATCLVDVLEHADALVHEHPVAARELATAVRMLAERSGRRIDPTPALTAANAGLLEGQVLAIEGRLEAALDAVDRARDAFVTAEEPWRALRTGLGRMHILNELGQNAEAIRLGADLLRGIDELERTSESSKAQPPFATDWLRASCFTNLGVCHTFAGDYAQAAAANALAEQYLTALGRWDEIAILKQNQAEQFLAEGRASDAREMFRRAANGFADAGLALLEARCLADLGRAHVALGDSAPALEAFAKAERLLVDLDVAADLLQVRLHTAEAYLGLNLYDEAAVVYEQVVTAVAASGLAHYHAVALSGRGAALAALGRWDEARAALEESAARHDRVGNVPLATAARVELAAVLVHRGEPDVALDLLRKLLERTNGERHQVTRVYVLLGLADVAGVPEAEAALAEASVLIQRLALPPLRFRVDSRMGALLRRQHRLDEARSLLERAADEAEVQRALLPSQRTRTSFLRDKARIFDELVALELDQGPDSAAAAFRAAERAKSRSLLDLVRTADPRVERRRPARGAGVADHDAEALVAELGAVFDEMLGSELDTSNATVYSAQRRAGELRHRAGKLQTRLSLARLVTASEGQLLRSDGLPDLHGLLERLSADTVVLAYHVVDGEVIGFCSIDGQVKARRVTTLERVGAPLAHLERHWRSMRAGPHFVQRHASRLAALVEHDLEELARELLDPLPLPVLAAGTVGRLVVVSPPELHGVPFHALPVGGRPLVADWEVVTSPSGSVLGSLPPWRYDARRPSVAFATVNATIPHAEGELLALVDLLPDLAVRVGVDATAAALRQDCQGAGIVHLACHGMFRPDNAVFSALRLADGWMTAGDAVSLNLIGTLVTLSACETGRQQAIGGEAVGLSWAFLAAGASAVLTSLWMADDASTSAHMQDFYRHILGGATPAAALREAQLASARSSGHPYYWAPFTVTSAF